MEPRPALTRLHVSLIGQHALPANIAPKQAVFLSVLVTRNAPFISGIGIRGFGLANRGEGWANRGEGLANRGRAWPTAGGHGQPQEGLGLSWGVPVPQ